MAQPNKGRKQPKNVNTGQAPQKGEGQKVKKEEESKVVDTQLDAPIITETVVEPEQGGEVNPEPEPEPEPTPEPEPQPEPEPEPEVTPEPLVAVTGPKVSVNSAVGTAVQRSLKHFVDYHTGDTASTSDAARTAATNLQRAYVLAITAGQDSKALLLDIMQEMHDNKKAFNAHTLYQSAPANDHAFYMAFTQWLYEVTRNPRQQWGKAMGELGHPATQRIMGLTPNPNVSRGFESFINAMYES